VTAGFQLEHNPPAPGTLIGFGVSMPLFVDGRQDGPIRRAGVALTEAEAQRERVRAQALADRRGAQAQVASARTQVERYEQDLVPQAREVAEATEFARQHGAMSLQDLLDARRTLHSVMLEAAQAHADHAKALANLDSPSNPAARDLHALTP